MEYNTPLNKLLYNFEVQYIYTFLNICDVVRASSTNKLMRKCLSDEGFWESVFRRDFHGSNGKQTVIEKPENVDTWKQFYSNNFWRRRILNTTFSSRHTSAPNGGYFTEIKITFQDNEKVRMYYGDCAPDYSGGGNDTNQMVYYGVYKISEVMSGEKDCFGIISIDDIQEKGEEIECEWDRRGKSTFLVPWVVKVMDIRGDELQTDSFQLYEKGSRIWKLHPPSYWKKVEYKKR